MKEYPEIVKRIHNEFNDAGESLLRQALGIISDSVNCDKAERLKRVGFTQVSDVKNLEKFKLTKNMADTIQHYKARYPNNKFITEEQVNIICNKYNLVCGPVASFTGFVPEVKLRQIECFSVAPDDIPEVLFRITKAWHTSAGVFAKKKVHAKRIHQELGMDLIPLSHPAISKVRNEPFSVYKNGEHNGGGYIDEVEYIENRELRICAPAKDMNISGLKKVGSSFLSFRRVKVPDPVVLQPVKGGYLIVAAWGDEASDPVVVNPAQN